MKRDYLQLQYNSSNDAVTVFAANKDAEIFMTKSEIADLFDVHIQAVHGNITSIFNSKELNRTQATAFVNGVLYYNFDTIIALAFRMKGGYCRQFREWITKELRRAFTPPKATPNIFVRYSDNKDVVN